MVFTNSKELYTNYIKNSPSQRYKFVKNYYKMRKIILSTLLVISFNLLQAANIYSTSTGGNWSDPATWAGGVVPGPSDWVYIEGGAIVVLDVNATIERLRFNAIAPSFGTLEISDAVFPKVLSSNYIEIQNNSNFNGKILVTGAEHEIHVGSMNIIDNTVPAGTALIDMPVGKLIFDLQIASPSLTTTNATLLAKNIQIGDGVNPSSFTLGACRLYPNGKAIVMNHATVISSNISFGNEPTASLVIRNGGVFMSSVGPLSNNGCLNLNLNEIDADIINGTYIQDTRLRRFLTNDTYNIPAGTYGNLYINETFESGAGLPQYKACPKLIRVNGSGARTVRIIGDFECKRAVTNLTAGANQTHGNVFFEGGLNAADCANVTWEFAGNGKTMLFGRDANIFFKGIYAGMTAADQPNVKISGDVSIANVINVPEASTTAFKDSIEFYHLEVTSTGNFGFGLNAIQPLPATPSPEHHRIKILGNLKVDGTINLKNSVRNILYFDNQSAANYSGNGLLTARKICGRTNGTVANASKITSTLNEIFLEPDMPFIYNTTVNHGSTYLFAGNYTWFEAEAGTLRIENKDYSTAPINYGATDKMIVWNGIEATHRIALNNLVIEDSTRFQLNSTFNNSATNFFKINGNVTAVGGWSTIEHANSTNPTNVLEFGGSTIQSINSLDSTNFQLHRIKINNPTKVVFNQSLKLNMGGGFGVAAQGPQLQLVSGVLQMGLNAEKMVHLDNIGTTFSNGVSNAINDGEAPLNANDYADSWVNGTIRMVVKQGSQGHNGSTGPNSFEYPVGTSTHSQVARISTNVFGDYWLNVKFNTNTTTQPNPATCFVNQNSNGPDYGAMNELVNAGYWTITPHVPLAAGHTPTVTLFARGYSNGNVSNPSYRYGLIKREDASAPWLGAGNDNTNTAINSGSHLNSEQTEANGVITCKRNNVVGFSDFAIGKKVLLFPLPIEMISFEVKRNGVENQLTWVTSSEQNTSHFEIEKSIDSENWNKVATIKAAGNSVTEKRYQLNDNEIIFGMNYYRIKSVDLDGKYSYSSVEKVYLENINDITIYPNPVMTTLNIALKNALENTLIEIYSLEGKKLMSENSSNLNHRINVETLAKGTYMIRISNKEKTYTSKFVRQ